jgi:hypothetical protein
MNLKVEIKDNIQKLAVEFFNSNMKELARSVDVNYNQLQSYGTRSVPCADVLRKFIDYGFSVDFILTGEGSMFAENKKGLELKIRYDKKYSDGKYKIVSLEFINEIKNMIRTLK